MSLKLAVVKEVSIFGSLDIKTALSPSNGNDEKYWCEGTIIKFIQRSISCSHIGNALRPPESQRVAFWLPVRMCWWLRSRLSWPHDLHLFFPSDLWIIHLKPLLKTRVCVACLLTNSGLRKSLTVLASVTRAAVTFEPHRKLNTLWGIYISDQAWPHRSVTRTGDTGRGFAVQWHQVVS